VIRNKTDQKIDAVHLSLNRCRHPGNLAVEGAGASRWKTEPRLPHLPPRRGPSPRKGRPGHVRSLGRQPGVRQSRDSNTKLVANGTFFRQLRLLPPHLGYSGGTSSTSPTSGASGASSGAEAPKIDDAAARQNNYISSEADWVHFETTVKHEPRSDRPIAPETPEGVGGERAPFTSVTPWTLDLRLLRLPLARTR